MKCQLRELRWDWICSIAVWPETVIECKHDSEECILVGEDQYLK